jgi:hypothetical protein
MLFADRIKDTINGEDMRPTEHTAEQIRYWRSFHELLGFVRDARPPADATCSHDPEFNSWGEGNWYNTKDFSEAVNLATNGWGDGAKRSMPMVNAITASVAARVVRETVITQDYPSSLGFSVPALLSGTPDYWYAFNQIASDNRQSPQVKLSISLCQSCGVPAKVMELKGAALAAIANALELSGKSVQIQADYTTTGYGGGYMSDVFIVKEYGQPLDLTAIIFAIGHASSLRRIGFAAWEQSPVEIRHKTGVGNGAYGSPTDCKETERGSIHIPSSYLYDGEADWNNRGSVEKWIAAKLESCGVILAHE